MNSKMYQDLEKIIGHYGINNQLKKFNEETYELVEAILTFGKENNYKSLNHIIEEMGDVYVVLKQLQIYYGISESEIEDIMKFKIERQLQRIESKKKGEIRIMNKEMLDILNDLSKKPTTELALQIMELSGENLILEQQCKKQKEVIDKIMNLIKKYGKYDGEKCTRGFQMYSADFNKILDILKEVE